MPIYEEAYRSWEGRLIPRPKTFLVIAKTGIRRLWKKGMILFVLLAYIPLVIPAVQIFIASRIDEGSELVQTVKQLQINPDFFFTFLKGQMFFFILILIFSGAGLIASDRRCNALTLYFSKPVSFWDYVAGKWLVVGFYGMLVTAVPSLILFLLRVFLARDMTFFNAYFWIPLASIGTTLLAVLTLGGLVLALSSISKSARSAAVFFFAFIMFTDLFRMILSKIPEVGLISLTRDLYQVASRLFGLQPQDPFPVWAAVIVLAAVNIGFLLILKWRIRPTEVVK
jgi:ABC-2 type transport system permease protein